MRCWCVVECSQCNIELAALVDASFKSSNNDWQNILNFVNSFAANFNVNPNCVRVAVILYADNAQASIPLNQYSNINSLQRAVSSLTVIGGGSNLATALQVLRNQVFASNAVRSGATLVAAIITDRLSCNSQITTEVNNVKSMGVIIVGVGVTSTGQVDINCLRQVVTPNQYIEVPNYNQLNNYVSQAVQYACVTPTSKLLQHKLLLCGRSYARFESTRSWQTREIITIREVDNSWNNP